MTNPLSLTSLVKGGIEPAQHTDLQAARGRVARQPASTNDSLYVTVPGFSLAFAYEIPPRQWNTGYGLPAEGTACLVVFDDDGDAWVPQLAAIPRARLGLSEVWRWTTVAPTAGRVGVGGGVVQIAKADWAGANFANLFLRVIPGDEIYLQDQDDATIWALYAATGAPADAGAYVTFAASREDGAGVFPNNANVLVMWLMR